MSIISLPQKVEYTPGEDQYSGSVAVLGCFPGYGTTLGNALRRVLLSSIEGSAVTSIKIKGVTHEFSSIDGVLEDVVQIVLNLKRLKVSVHTDEPIVVKVKKSGEGEVTAADIETTADVDVIDPEQVIATITDKKTAFEAEMTLARGIGYVPVDQQEREEIELGAIAIDAVYTAIKRVNFSVENMRVGKRTDYEKVTLAIETDGSITPEDAFKKSVEILSAQFDFLHKSE